MRIYYIFKINEDYAKLTKNKPFNLYQVLENIYLMNNEDLILSYKMFEEVAIQIDRKNINTLIFNLYKDNLNYSCFNNVHTYNDYLKGEETKLILNNSHIKVKSNQNFPTFLRDFNGYKNLFVCDFINNDYFWLKDTLKSVVV